MARAFVAEKLHGSEAGQVRLAVEETEGVDEPAAAPRCSLSNRHEVHPGDRRPPPLEVGDGGDRKGQAVAQRPRRVGPWKRAGLTCRDEDLEAWAAIWARLVQRS